MRNANNHVISALRSRYARTLGLLLRAGPDDAGQLAIDLVHLIAVLRLFGASADGIKPIRPYTPPERWNRTALAILRTANGPMTARALARRVLEARGKPPTLGNLQRVECSLHSVLGRLEGRGVVRVGNDPKRWAIG